MKSTSPDLEVTLPRAGFVPVIFYGVISAALAVAVAVDPSLAAGLACLQASAATVVFLRIRRRPVRLVVRDEGLSVGDDGLVAWAEMESVRFSTRSAIFEADAHRSPWVTVFHARGRIELPLTGDYDRKAVLDRIRACSGLSGRPGPLPAAIAAEYARAMEKYGPGRVFASVSEPRSERGHLSKPLAWFTGIAFVTVVSVGVVMPGTPAGFGWLIALLLIHFFLLVIVAARESGRAVRIKAGRALLITPEAFYVESKEVRGRLDWKDIRGVGAAKRPAISLGRVEPGFRLRLHGADHVVEDIYRHPFHEIVDRIRGFAGESPPPL